MGKERFRNAEFRFGEPCLVRVMAAQSSATGSQQGRGYSRVGAADVPRETAEALLQ